MKNKKIKLVIQTESSDCGFACIAMLSQYFGNSIELFELKNTYLLTNVGGLSINDLKKVCIDIGFECLPLRISLEEFRKEFTFPCIAFLPKRMHYIVIEAANENYIHIVDPSEGRSKIEIVEFKKDWLSQKDTGILLQLIPTKDFFTKKFQKKKKRTLDYIKEWTKPYKWAFILIVLLVAMTMVVNLILPFCTKKLVDNATIDKDISETLVISFFFFFLYILNALFDFIKSRVFIKVGNKINIKIVSVFLHKLFALPMQYFNNNNIGSLIQKVYDHNRIEDYLTKNLIVNSFSIFMLILLSSILFYFNIIIGLIFTILTILQVVSILYFIPIVKKIDQKIFKLSSVEQNMLVNSILGIQDIKLNLLEKDILQKWHDNQMQIFKENIYKVKMKEREQIFTRFLNYLNIVSITALASLLVIQNTITIGEMMAIIFILGLSHAPISSLINLIISTQLARLSLKRVLEIQDLKEEVTLPKNKERLQLLHSNDFSDRHNEIIFKNVSFKYSFGKPVLQNINLKISFGKITSIVGASGSGKTTLLKLILQLYQPSEGIVLLNKKNINHYQLNEYRSYFGSILQDSFFFNDTVKFNVILSKADNKEKYTTALKMANIYDFVQSLPQKSETKIGEGAVTLSSGQKQRILLARLFYKNPKFIILDESTNFLDARNEEMILQNVFKHFSDATIIIVSHRLSTIKDADQIVVLKDGQITEIGTHDQLVNAKNHYYDLVKKQLTLVQSF